MIRLVAFFVLLGGALTLPSNSVASTDPAPPAMDNPSLPPPQRAATVGNALGLRLLRALPETAQTPNLCLSPYSIAAALAMTYPGSAGETRTQMAAALGFPEDPKTLAGDFAALDALLPPPREDPDIAILRANRLFGQKETPFRAPFLELLQKSFQAPLEPTDFQAAPEAARLHINYWVAEQTRDKIQDLLPANSIEKDTRLVLVNALYFKAPWAEEFPAQATTPGNFRALSGEAAQVNFMRQTERMGYAEVGEFHVVALPYRGIPYQMLLILPREADAPVPVWPEAFDAAQLAQLKEINSTRVKLTLPKFRITPATLALADTLAGLGMPSAFDRPRGSADFDAMAPRLPDDYLYISGVFHKTFIEVDEKGTEAAAATAVAMMRATMMDMTEPVEVTFDRPFWFALQHRPSGACLFLGRVGQP